LWNKWRTAPGNWYSVPEITEFFGAKVYTIPKNRCPKKRQSAQTERRIDVCTQRNVPPK